MPIALILSHMLAVLLAPLSLVVASIDFVLLAPLLHVLLVEFRILKLPLLCALQILLFVGEVVCMSHIWVCRRHERNIPPSLCCCQTLFLLFFRHA